MSTRVYNPGKQTCLWYGHTPFMIPPGVTTLDLPKHLVEAFLKHEDYRQLSFDIPDEGAPAKKSVEVPVPSAEDVFDPFDAEVSLDRVRAYATKYNLQLTENVDSESLREAVADHMFENRG